MKIIKISLLILLLIPMIEVGADKNPASQAIQVIVNDQSKLRTLNRQQIMSLFLGRSRSFPNGQKSKTFDHKMDSPLRQNFFEWLTGKSISDIDAYWARLRYSGRTSPPKVLKNQSETIRRVSNNANAIAYIREQNPMLLAKKGIVVVHTLRNSDAQ